MKINEVIIDNVNGAGSVPWNEEVDYMGLRVLMKPSIFLKLTPELSDWLHKEHIDKFQEYMKGGGTIGAPFLTIEIPDDWKKDIFKRSAKVMGHEGRHRMSAVLKFEGDEPIETHLFFGGWRHHHFEENPEWIQQLNTRLKSQRGILLRGPFFKVINEN